MMLSSFAACGGDGDLHLAGHVRLESADSHDGRLRAGRAGCRHGEDAVGVDVGVVVRCADEGPDDSVVGVSGDDGRVVGGGAGLYGRAAADGDGCDRLRFRCLLSDSDA